MWKIPRKAQFYPRTLPSLKDHHIRDYFCDTMRMAINGTEAFELDQILELDMDVHHHQASHSHRFASAPWRTPCQD